MRKLKAILGILLCLLACFGGLHAAEAAQALPPGMVIGDSDGVYATSEGEYYVDLVDILPGDTYTKEVTIRSLDLEEPFSLGLLVEEIDSTGSVDWKEHITMTLTLDDKEIYQGPILGDGETDWTKTPLDSSLTNEDLRDDSILNFYWTFVGTKDQKPTEPTEPTEPSEPTVPSEPTTPSGSGDLPKTGGGTASGTSGSGKRLPQTGEQLVYQFLSGLLLVLLALFLWKKRREEEQE